MIDQKYNEIEQFFIQHADPAIVAKYSRYFKEGYQGYGIDKDVFQDQMAAWLDAWKGEMSITDYLDLSDRLVASGNYEKTSSAIHFIARQQESWSPEVFDRVGNWLENGIDNWASTDVLCMMVLSDFLRKNIIQLERFADWRTSPSKWKRRAVPVTLVEMVKEGFDPPTILPFIEPLMLDHEEDVQKGLGTLLRELWKKYPAVIEDFLIKWKDQCGRLIVRYATEKMDKEERKRFRKAK